MTLGLKRKDVNMLWTLVVVLLILWALGMVSFPAIGGLVHLLLVLAVIVVVFNLISGRSGAGTV
jgi:hypothetical protein